MPCLCVLDVDVDLDLDVDLEFNTDGLSSTKYNRVS